MARSASRWPRSYWPGCLPPTPWCFSSKPDPWLLLEPIKFDQSTQQEEKWVFPYNCCVATTILSKAFSHDKKWQENNGFTFLKTCTQFTHTFLPIDLYEDKTNLEDIDVASQKILPFHSLLARESANHEGSIGILAKEIGTEIESFFATNQMLTKLQHITICSWIDSSTTQTSTLWFSIQLQPTRM